MNAQRDTTKLESIINNMRTNNIDAWLLQETWEEGDAFDVDVGGYCMFMHNADPGPTG